MGKNQPARRASNISARTPTSYHRRTPASQSSQPSLQSQRFIASSGRASPIANSDLQTATLPEVVLSLHLNQQKTLGCSFYVAKEEKLHVVEDVRFADITTIDQGWQFSEMRHSYGLIFSLVKLFVEPTVILVSTRVDPELLGHLESSMQTSSDGMNLERSLPEYSYLLERRSNADFGYEAAIHKLTNLRLDTSNITFAVPGDVVFSRIEGLDQQSQEEVIDQPHAGEQGRVLQLSSWLDLESRVSVGSAGALINYLHRRLIAMRLPDDSIPVDVFRISRVQMTSLSGYMHINNDTLTALQIMSKDCHPNPQSQGPSHKVESGGAKEGSSLYAIFHQEARTPQGRYLLRQYLLRPSMDLHVINQRLSSIAVLLYPVNADALERLDQGLGKLKDMRKALQSLRRGTSNSIGQKKNVSVATWISVRNFVYYIFRLLDAIHDLESARQIRVCVKMAESFDRRSLATVGKLISETIDIETSKLNNSIVIQQGIDKYLDETKRLYHGLESLLTLAAENIARTIPAALEAVINVIFFPQIGFLISIRRSSATDTGVFEGADDEPWEKMFATDENAYYKSGKMTALDDRFGDVYGKVCDREIEIAQALASQILSLEDCLTSASDLCAELDCLVAFAKVARRYNFVRPHVVAEKIVNIVGGRHPIQEMAVSAFMPNETILGAIPTQELPSTHSMPQQLHGHHSDRSVQESSLIILTGPNQSGKSIYLKQVAMIVYMAHIGSFVPADSATIGLTDKILTRISTRASVSRSASAFLIDLQQVSMALTLATAQSLVVIDEFGKGTDHLDGAGLLTSVLEHFLQMPESRRPKVICATHLHEIFEAGFLPTQPHLQFAHMEIRMDINATEREHQVTYLYKCIAGRSSSSFGTFCAALNGINASIVNRAEELILLASKGESLIDACTELSPSELAEYQDAETIAATFLAQEDHSNPKQQLIGLLSLGSQMTQTDMTVQCDDS